MPSHGKRRMNSGPKDTATARITNYLERRDEKRRSERCCGSQEYCVCEDPDCTCACDGCACDA